MGFIDWIKEVFGFTVQVTPSGNCFRIEKSEKRDQIIKNYNNEKIEFIDNWDLTHFEELSIVQDGEDTRIKLPNQQVIIVRNKSASFFTHQTFIIPNTGLGSYDGVPIHDGMPQKTYIGTDNDDTQNGVWSVGSTLKGLKGHDRLLGGLGKDSIYGGDGNDQLYGADNDDYIEGNAGNDSISGGSGDDRMLGGDDNDLLKGETGDDTLDGGSGNDTLMGGEGYNILTGGDGSDIFIFYPKQGQKDVITDFDPKNDMVHLETFPDMAFENFTFQESDEDTTLVLKNQQMFVFKNLKKNDLGPDHFKLNGKAMPQAHYVGTPGNDIRHGYADVHNTLYGRFGNDRLTGDNLSDTIYGEEGDDWISSGSGNDYVDGGEGNDTIEGEEGDDTLSGGKGKDLISGGYGSDTISGGEGHDHLQGGPGADTIDGGHGDDYIRGDEGRNILRGGLGTDHFLIAVRPNEQDSIEDYSPQEEKIYFDQSIDLSFSDLIMTKQGSDTCISLPNNQSLILKNVAPDALNKDCFVFSDNGMPRHVVSGTENRDVLFGEKILNNSIFGMGGDDLIFGGDYNDIIDSGSGHDVINGGGGNDILHGGLGNDTLNGGSGDDSLYADGGFNILCGGDGHDRLYSGLEHNALFGDSGNDILHLAGMGQFSGGSGADIFKIYAPSSNENRDTCNHKILENERVITDFNPAEKGEKIDLSLFPEIKSFEDLNCDEKKIVRDPEKWLSFSFESASGTCVGVKNYKKDGENSLVMLSKKGENSSPLVGLYGVKKTDLTPDHFIFFASEQTHIDLKSKLDVSVSFNDIPLEEEVSSVLTPEENDLFYLV
jgi:Ca2+-binding RTX toxin-like protein